MIEGFTRVVDEKLDEEERRAAKEARSLPDTSEVDKALYELFRVALRKIGSLDDSDTMYQRCWMAMHMISDRLHESGVSEAYEVASHLALRERVQKIREQQSRNEE